MSDLYHKKYTTRECYYCWALSMFLVPLRQSFLYSKARESKLWIKDGRSDIIFRRKSLHGLIESLILRNDHPKNYM